MPDIQSLEESGSILNSTKFIANDGKVRSFTTLKSKLVEDILGSSYEEGATNKAFSQEATMQLVSNFVNNLAEVARTGSYDDLYNKPTIPASQIQSDWNQSDDSQLDYIKNQPTIPASQIQSDWNQSDDSQLDYIKNKLAISTLAQALAGTDDTSAITPAKLFSLFSSASLSANSGYFKIPFMIAGARANVIIQLGTDVTATTVQNITFPIVFPTACCAVVGTIIHNAGASVSTSAPTTTGFTAYKSSALGFKWIALGYELI